MQHTIYSNLRVLADERPLSELQAGNLIESKEEYRLVLTSAIPKDGIEFNPDIGQKVKIDYLISNLHATMTVSCIEKKLSKSVNKEAYQLLTFDVLEISWADLAKEVKDALQYSCVHTECNEIQVSPSKAKSRKNER